MGLAGLPPLRSFNEPLSPILLGIDYFGVARIVEHPMSVNRKFVVAPEPAKPEPIQYLTENGFSIIRHCDVDGSAPQGGQEHAFIVRDPDGYELYITVTISAEAEADAILRSRGRITYESSFWLCMAERHLAEYLWEHDDYPPDAKLFVDQLTPTDVDQSQRWNCETS